ncbi:Scr1 family TA system antitoxin-like transcriptional regulator [Streptomyces mirabilis]|uniref:Scr1 family TA system antitoxin-like transcriptional regulator n=1 Tax=Streptomyces mirabilis TaxID=68239 RepID=UPI0033301BAE
MTLLACRASEAGAGLSFCQGYSPDLVSGLLQTSEYAAAVLRLVVDFYGTPDDIEAGVAARTARAQYVGQEDRTFHILLGDEALNTHLGGPEAMRGQLRRLLDAMDLPGLSLGIIPARAPRSLSWRRILDLRRPQGRGRGIPRGRDDPDQDRVDLFRKAFGLLHPSAVYGQAARDLITAVLATS